MKMMMNGPIWNVTSRDANLLYFCELVRGIVRVWVILSECKQKVSLVRKFVCWHLIECWASQFATTTTGFNSRVSHDCNNNYAAVNIHEREHDIATTATAIEGPKWFYIGTPTTTTFLSPISLVHNDCDASDDCQKRMRLNPRGMARLTRELKNPNSVCKYKIDWPRRDVQSCSNGPPRILVIIQLDGCGVASNACPRSSSTRSQIYILQPNILPAAVRWLFKSNGLLGWDWYHARGVGGVMLTGGRKHVHALSLVWSYDKASYL